MALTTNTRRVDISGEYTLQQSIERTYNRLVERVAELQCAIDDYSDSGAYVPIDILESYQERAALASAYAARYGFDCDVDTLDA